MHPLAADEARRMSQASFTYAEVGATVAGVLPTGFRTIRRERRCGGAIDFDTARRALFEWDLHERAGLEVRASSPVEVGAVVRLGFRLWPVTTRAPCRVVAVIDEPDRAGFAYGTLPGHPESGEELFEILHHDGAQCIRITAFSRPARPVVRLAGPAARRIQDRITERYLRALG
jgi:uncharacterized protein (UPF0548 family)